MSAIDEFQERVAEWVKKTFGEPVLNNRFERGLRVVEEAVEVAQALNIPREDVLRIVWTVYARPVGQINQELAGTAVTLLALAESVGVNLHDVLDTEVERIERKDPEAFRKRNREKAALGIGLYPEGYATA